MKIAVMGAAGRMGRQLISAISAAPGCVVSGATETAGSPLLGKDIGELAGLEPLGISVSSDAAAVIAGADAIVDFTIPKASVEFARLAAKSGTAHIIGTTGFDAASDAAIADAATKTAIVKAGNMSLGVNLLVALTRQVAAALGNDFDIEIVEMHHRMKIDAPSGTALMLGEAAAVRPQYCAWRPFRTGPRWPYRPAASRRYWICDPSRRQRRRRSHGDFCRRGRAHRADASRRRPRHFCARRGESRDLDKRPCTRPLRHDRRARY